MDQTETILPGATPAPESEKPEKPSISGKVFRWCATIAIFAFISYKIDLQSLLHTLMGADPLLYVLALLLILTEQTVTAMVWRQMLMRQAISVPVVPVLKITFVSNFIGFAFPSSSGPDFVRVVGLARYIKNRTAAFASMLIIRVMSMSALFGIALFSIVVFSAEMPVIDEMKIISLLVLTGFICSLCGLLIAGPAYTVARKIAGKSIFGKLAGKLEKVHATYEIFIKDRKALLLAGAGAIYIQLANTLVAVIMAEALGIDISIAILFAFVPVINAATKLPLSVAGLGLREGGYVLLMGFVGVSTEQALALSLSIFSLSLVIVACAGIYYTFSGMPETTDNVVQKGNFQHL